MCWAGKQGSQHIKGLTSISDKKAKEHSIPVWATPEHIKTLCRKDCGWSTPAAPAKRKGTEITEVSKTNFSLILLTYVVFQRTNQLCKSCKSLVCLSLDTPQLAGSVAVSKKHKTQGQVCWGPTQVCTPRACWETWDKSLSVLSDVPDLCLQNTHYIHASLTKIFWD